MKTERRAALTEFVAGRLEAAAMAVRAYGAGSPGVAPHASAKVLVLGGVRSGKSHEAERLISRYGEVTYVAGGLPPSQEDPDWAARVAAHRARRPAHWHTVEGEDLADTLRTATTPVLIDCLGTWLSRELDELGAWAQEQGWQQRVDDRLAGVVDAYTKARVPIVAVSNEVGSGVVPGTTPGRVFRDVLGALNSQISAHSDTVLLAVAGRVLPLEDMR